MSKNVSIGLALAALLAAPFVGIYPVFVLKILCFALFALAFNLLLGYTGLLSFGHAAFFGGGGYAAAYALKSWGITPEFALLLGAATGAVLGALTGMVAIRRQGIYFAMITLALAQMFYFFCLQAPFTGREDGLQGVPRGALFGIWSLEDDLAMYYAGITVLTAAFALVVRILRSPFGEVLAAIRENESRAISLGYDTARFKLIAFTLSAMLAGLAGALKALVLGFESLADVHWTMSASVILMTLLGGLGTLAGPIVGAAAIVLLENRLGSAGNLLAEIFQVEWLRSVGESVGIATGLIFIACVLLFRRGLAGELQALLQVARRR
jgi:branched-chain amino acid transport system permease protein